MISFSSNDNTKGLGQRSCRVTLINSKMNSLARFASSNFATSNQLASETNSSSSLSNLILFGLLGFFVLSSKHFIIYNEETLVVISFIAFVLFSYNMLNQSIQDSLNERSTAIYNELQNSLQIKEYLLKELLEEHKKQLSIKNLLNTLNKFCSSEILQVNSQRQKALQNVFAQQIQQKLKTLLLSQNKVSELLQEVIVAGFRASVLEEFQNTKQYIKPKLLQEALRELKTY
jgi:hypothetical protein